MPKKTSVINIRRMTATNIAKLWGKSRQAVQNWYKRAGCPRNADGTYDLPKVIKWRESRLRKEAEEEGGGPARERKLEAEAGIAEMKLKVMNDALVDRAEYEQAEVGRVLMAKDAFLGLAGRLCYELSGKEPAEIRAKLTEEIKQVCRVLAGGAMKD